MDNYEFFATNVLEQDELQWNGDEDEYEDDLEVPWLTDEDDEDTVDEYYYENHTTPPDEVEIEYYDARGNRVDEEGNYIDNNGLLLSRDEFGNPIGNVATIQLHIPEIPPIEG
jgi:hypothetical protein